MLAWTRKHYDHHRAQLTSICRKPALERRRDKIRPTHVEAWVKSMSVASGTRTEALAPGTIKTRFVNVRSVFRAAMRDKVIGSDPTEGVRLPRSVADAAMSIPSPADVAALLGSADERFLALVAVCAFAGLRLGEAAALQVDDVDFLRRQLHVRRQVERGSAGAVEIRLPKYGSEHAVPIPDELVTMLAAHVALGHRGAWLFQGAGGTPRTRTPWATGGARRSRLRACPIIRLHDLRHFYASGIIAAGCDVVTVQRALGHSKATTTLTTYSHLWPSAEDKTRTAAATLAGEVLGAGVGNLRAGGGD